VWPAIILANKRTDKEIGLKMYETNSIGTNKKANPKELPPGKNKFKKFDPCIFKQIIFIPIKIAKAKLKVMIKWLVIVKLYGTNPITFEIKTNKKIDNIKGKKR
jgi:hypothetical protein